jgi:rubredoxin
MSANGKNPRPKISCIFDRTKNSLPGGKLMKKYVCELCGYVYDEAEGAPDDGIPAGTKWEDVPEDWECPDCGAGKEDFVLEE